MVDLFLLPKGKQWNELSAWVWDGEYPNLTEAQEAARLKLEKEPDKWCEFEIQGKVHLN
jgi:hypothetical protein